MKISFIINTDMLCLLERIDTCHNNLKPSTTKITNHLASGYSLFTHIVQLIQQKISLILIETKIV